MPWLYLPPPWPNVRSPNDEKYNGCIDKLTVFIPVTKWYNVRTSFTQMKEVATAFHDEMSPRDPNSTETFHGDPTEEHTEFRSNFRITFIKGTVKAAKALYLKLINHDAWTDAYLDSQTLAGHELVQEHLIQPARNLTDNLNKQYRKSGNPKELLLFVFDEAANLWIGTEGKNKLPFFALRRVLGLLKDLPIWSFLLSTQSPIGSFLPPRETDRSERMCVGRLSTLEPFLTLQLNMAAAQAVDSKVKFDEALRKPMSQFATAEHMTMFGRSLWRAYLTIAPSAFRRFVLEKLIHNTTYDCRDANHVFAALASRLCLDVCMDSAEAIALACEAVNSYLRVVISIDTSQNEDSDDDHSNISETEDSDDDHSNISETEDLDRNRSNLNGKSDSGEQHWNSIERQISVKFNPSTTGRRITSSLPRMVTITPSEPVVAEAVAELLCTGANWSESIYTLTKHLLSKGLVEKGLKGELFARLLCILARDIHLTEVRNAADSFPYAKTFSVNDFLQSLFGSKQFQKIKQFTPEVPQTRAFKRSESASFYDVFKKGSMNFTHFTNTDVFLHGENESELLHILLQEQLALQLAFGEPTCDILIPIYFGDLDQDFDPARASAVVISVKNRRSASKLSFGPQISEMFSHTKDPVLCILVDLGVENATVNVQGLPKRPSEQYIFGIHAEGAGVETYGCLRGYGLQDPTTALLQQILRPNDPRGVRGDHDEFCHRDFLGPKLEEWEAAKRKFKTRDAEAEVAAEVAEQDVVKRNAEESDTEEWDGTEWNGM